MGLTGVDHVSAPGTALAFGIEPVSIDAMSKLISVPELVTTKDVSGYIFSTFPRMKLVCDFLHRVSRSIWHSSIE